MFLRTRRKIYELKFGLKCLILLRENLNIVATEDLDFLLYCGLISQHPDITFQEIQEIIEECDLSSLHQPANFLSLNQVQELYTKAVGEIGIAPSDAYAMTPDEINLAYEGYLRRKETEANLVKLAIASQGSEELIRLTEDKGYQIGDLQERNKFFAALGIKENSYGL